PAAARSAGWCGRVPSAPASPRSRPGPAPASPTAARWPTRRSGSGRCRRRQAPEKSTLMLLSWLTDGDEPQPGDGSAGGDVLPPGQPGIQRAGERVTGPVVSGSAVSDRVVTSRIGLGALAGADQVQQVGLAGLARGGPRRDPGGAGRAGRPRQPSRLLPGPGFLGPGFLGPGLLGP